MTTLDQARLTADRAHPRILDLWWALRPLTSVIRFMNTGAHPDDETSAMLAALALRDGINLSYACSTRGEGGQNDIGTEAAGDLGALRTREMERACDLLGMRLYWHSQHPKDSITDFGFSKSGVETLAKWGAKRTLDRFVEIVRTDRPDIICPTFLDIPGQHGHHRAMTQLAHEVMAAAAAPDHPCDLPPWQVKKLYLPAWSGAGQAYDDDLPPPPATLVIEAKGGDPVSGWSWERIGQQSRAFHRTQGMGRWVPAGEGRDYPLHLALSHLPGPDETLAAGLSQTLSDLAETPGAKPIATALRAAQAEIDAALKAYPAFETVAAATRAAHRYITDAAARCPDAVRGEMHHRLVAKRDQLAHAVRIASGIEARARTQAVWLHPGDSTPISLETSPDPAALEHRFELPSGWTINEGVLSLGPDAALTDPYRDSYDPASPTAPALVVVQDGVEIALPFEAPPVVLPRRLASLTPSKTIVNSAAPRDPLHIHLADMHPNGADASLDVPPGWHSERIDTGFLLSLPEDVSEGLYQIPLRIDGAQAHSARRIEYDHIDATARTEPACIEIRVAHVALPRARVGYIGSGHDRVHDWLAAVGLDITALTDEELQSDAALAKFDSIVVGIFALRFRSGLLDAMPRLHRWMEAGGTLVTLYHRPWDNWDPDTVPPRRLEIGQPSLRWRVTDETAPVTHLFPHALLSTPNPIGPDAWEGWHKERGLYFAKSWDSAYEPLLEMADPDEAPHRGALLVADIGAGRHVHTSLILHHQMANLVPGAFKLMANILAPRA
ncbi:MAG: PIG-L family deacetylase [Pseudomonadota bacterium]